MKILTIKRKISLSVPDDVNMKDVVDSLNRALRMWALVKGLEPVGTGELAFDLHDPPKLKPAKKKVA